MGGMCSFDASAPRPSAPTWGIRVTDYGDRTPLNKDNAPYTLQVGAPVTPKDLSVVAWNLTKKCVKSRAAAATKGRGKYRLALDIPGTGRLQPLFSDWNKPLDNTTLRIFSLDVCFAPSQAPAAQVGTYTFEVLEPAEVKRLHGLRVHHVSCSACLRKTGMGCMSGIMRCVDCIVDAKMKKSRRRAARITASLSSVSLASSVGSSRRSVESSRLRGASAAPAPPTQETFEAMTW